MRTAKDKAASIQAGLASLREKRQGLLATGGNVDSIRRDIAMLTSDVEIRQDETEDLKKLLSILQSEEASLSTKPEGLRRRRYSLNQ